MRSYNDRPRRGGPRQNEDSTRPKSWRRGAIGRGGGGLSKEIQLLIHSDALAKLLGGTGVDRRARTRTRIKRATLADIGSGLDVYAGEGFVVGGQRGYTVGSAI